MTNIKYIHRYSYIDIDIHARDTRKSVLTFFEPAPLRFQACDKELRSNKKVTTVLTLVEFDTLIFLEFREFYFFEW